MGWAIDEKKTKYKLQPRKNTQYNSLAVRYMEFSIEENYKYYRV